MTETTVVNEQVVDTLTGEVLGAAELHTIKRDEVVTGLSVENVFSSSSDQILTSFNPTTPLDKMKLYNAIQSDAKSLKDTVNIEFVMEHYVAHNVEFNEEDGSKTQGVRIILLSDKGEAFSGSGAGIRNSLQKIFSIFGKPDTWEGFKLKVKPVSKKVGDQGESTVILELVDVIQEKK